MEQLRSEVFNIEHQIAELKEKSEKLTNGQRYAAINEIEKSLVPLREDLRKMESLYYQQNADSQKINKKYNKLWGQLQDLENIKSDLTARIHTENEHTKNEIDERLFRFLKEEVSPLKKDISETRKEIGDIRESLIDFQKKIEKDNYERKIEEAQKFDRIKWIITATVAALTALSALVLWLEPAFKILIHVLF